MKNLLFRLINIIFGACIITSGYGENLLNDLHSEHSYDPHINNSDIFEQNFDQLTYYTKPNSKRFVFNPKTNRWYAYNSWGLLINSGTASGGAHYCKDVGRSCRTPVGTFRVYRKGNKWCRSSKYPLGGGGAPMPYCVHFYRGYAIHGSHDVPRNRHASHGCIRVKHHAARWLNKHFLTKGTKVIVKPY